PRAAAALLRSASVAAVPAPMDNFPLTCVEAMARGKLIVSAAAGGMAEMIRDGVEGLLFAPGDEASCADALRRALSMPPAEATAMGARAARRILHLCGNEAVVAARIAHYRSAAVAHHAPSNTPPALVVSG